MLYIQIVIYIVLGFLLLYVLVKQLKAKRKEKFENRKN